MNWMESCGRRAVSAVATAAFAATFVLAGCAGEKGDAGPQGPSGESCTVTESAGVKTITCPDGTSVVVKDGQPGQPGEHGQPGENGVAQDKGTITGTLTADIGGAAEGVAVTTTPDVGVSATSDAEGSFTLALPIGTYTVTLASEHYAKKEVPAVVVTGGAALTLKATLAAINPIAAVAPAATKPAGFGATAQLDVTVHGGTAPFTYAWTAKATNPTAVTLSDAAAKNPTFQTGTLAGVIASGKVIGLELSRKGLVPVSAQQLAQMTYAFECKVTDAKGFSKTVTVSVPAATTSPGTLAAPRNQIVIVNVPGNTEALTLSKPAAATAELQEASSATPWFIPDVAGLYTVAGITVDVGDYKSSNKNCGGCHNTAVTADVDEKFKQWANSAHGNHFFKYMEYDAAGNLVWKKDAKGNPIPAPTSEPDVFWTEPGAMTTFQYGMTGAEGSHYGSNCIGCHTTGYNALASNGGFDDAAAAAGWTFPNLKAELGGDHATPAPVLTAWDKIPAEVKKYEGMQCESCHGPLGRHRGGVATPKVEWDVGNCAVCHDKPAKHDRVALWRQSAHANLEDAIVESAVENRGTSTSCYRCHSAQGFALYLKNKDQDPSQIVRPTTCPWEAGSALATAHCDGNALKPAATCTPAAMPNGEFDPACPCKPSAPATTCTGDPAFFAYLSSHGLNKAEVQPITCAACHDPHTTKLRVEGDTGPLPHGGEVKGAGSGALCMVCHNSRNGARGDFVAVSSISAPHAPVQTDLMMGTNAYFMGAGNKTSAHMAVKDTCAGCHVEMHPEGTAVALTNHTFAASEESCKECHSEGVNVEAINGQFMLARAGLEKAIATAFTNAVGGATPNYYVLVAGATQGSLVTLNLTTAPKSIVPSGRTQNLAMTFATPVDDGKGGTTTTLTVNFQNVSLSDTLTATGKAFATPAFSKTGIIAKTNWNYHLVSSVTANPAANVIHNPRFVFDVLSATTTKLLGADPSEL